MKHYITPRSLAIDFATEHALLSLSSTDENVDDSDKTQRRSGHGRHPIWGSSDEAAL